MTGFARVEGTCDAGRLTVEVRSVNHRYLEPTLRLPDRLRGFETDLRTQMKDRLQRGKVDCYLRLDETAGSVGFDLNQDVLDGLAEAVDRVRATVPDATPPNPLELLRWPGLLDSPVTDEAALKRDVNATFAEALDVLVATRESEGAALEGYVLERLDGVAKVVDAGRAIAVNITARLRERLRQRIEKLQQDNLDEGRLEQEVALLAQKADVDEELDRLSTHIDEIRATFHESGKGAIGRRLDFLMQELNREANTLAAKASQTETTLQAVELKLLVEQMREQIQNIE